MEKVMHRVVERCEHGFSLRQKVWLSILGVVYIACPLDALPDVIAIVGWLDDGAVLWLLYRVWRSPTLPFPPSGGSPVVPRSEEVRGTLRKPVSA